MNKRSLAITAGVVASVTAPLAMADEPYVFDENHTEIRFSWDHLGFSTTSAYFREVSGTLHFDEDNPTASELEMTLPINGLDTGRPEFTEHLLSEDFFEADTYPEGHFRSTAIHSDGDNRYRVEGELTLREITQDVTLDVTINNIGENPISGDRTIGFDAATDVLRSDFDMGMYTPMVGDEVTIEVSSEMIHEADLD